MMVMKRAVVLCERLPYLHDTVKLSRNEVENDKLFLLKGNNVYYERLRLPFSSFAINKKYKIKKCEDLFPHNTVYNSVKTEDQSYLKGTPSVNTSPLNDNILKIDPLDQKRSKIILKLEETKENGLRELSVVNQGFVYEEVGKSSPGNEVSETHSSDLVETKTESAVILQNSNNCRGDTNTEKSKGVNFRHLDESPRNTIHSDLRSKNEGKMRYTCNECGGTYTRRGHLQVHIKSHYMKQWFPCELCRKLLSTKAGLKNHLKIHSGEKTFICGECGKKFFHRTALARHIKRRHTKEGRILICNDCGKVFRDKSDLITHTRIHTDYRPYKCSFCPKSFKQSGAARNHEKIHIGEKRYQSKVCSKKFLRQAYLGSHMRMHTKEHSFVCKTCAKGFVRRSCYNKHMEYHVGEKKIICHECGKQFLYRSNFSAHVRGTHRKERNCECKICGKAYFRRHDLRKHEKLHLPN